MAATQLRGEQVETDGVTMSVNASHQLQSTEPVLQGTAHPTVGVTTAYPFYVLSVVIKDASIAAGGGLGGNGIFVQLNDASLALGSAGIFVQPGDTSLVTSGTGIAVSLASNPGLQISSGLKLKLTDTSLALGAGGVGVNLATVSGLQISSGLAVQLVSGGGLAFSTNSLYVKNFGLIGGDPGTIAQGDIWMNTSTSIPKIGLFAGIANQFVTVLFGGSQGNVVSNTTTNTTMTPNVTVPAGFLNLSGRTVRMKFYLGGSGLSATTFTVTLTYNGTVIWTTVFAGPTMSNMDVDLVCTTTATGGSGQLLVLGKYFNASTAYTQSNAVTTVNLTAGGLFSFKGQWSSASVSNAAQLSLAYAELIV